MEFPSYRVALVPYEAHEYLRPHLGVDLTGKLRDWLSPIAMVKQMFYIVKGQSYFCSLVQSTMGCIQSRAVRPCKYWGGAFGLGVYLNDIAV